MSLNRFRHTNTSSSSNKPLFEISLPAAPKPTHSRALYKHSRVKVASPSTSFEDTDDDIIPLTGSSISSHSSKSSTSSSSSGDSASASASLSLPISRNNSFKMKTLDPRRLSMRFKSNTSSSTSRPNSPLSSASRDMNNDNSTTFTTNRAHTDPLPFPSTSSSAGRADFIYKPIRRTDYTTVVAETATAQNPIQTHNRVPLSSASPSRYQYNYISARAESSGKERRGLGLPIAPQPRDRTRIRARAQAHYALHDDEDDDPYNDLDGGYIPSSTSRGYGHEYAVPAPALESSASAAERKRVKAARRLTTVMVPDAEDIYG